MRLIERYIGHSVIAATVLVVLILLGVESFVEFINELGSIGTGHYGILDAFIYVPLTLPSELYQLFPMAGLLGCLLGLGRLASSNQLVVIRAAGVSRGRITLAVLKAAFVMMIVVTLIGEVIAPRLDRVAEHMKNQAIGRAVGYSALHDIWLRQKQSFIHVGQVQSPTKLLNVTRFEFDQHRLVESLYSQTAVLDQGTWLMPHPVETRIASDHTSSQRLPAIHLDFALKPELIAQNQQDPARISGYTLWRNIRYRKQHGLLSEQFAFAFWQRVVQPLTTLVMIALGAPFIFGSLRNVTMGYRIMMGILLGFGFYMLNQFFGPISMVYQFPPWLAAILPTIMFALLGVWLMRRSV